MFEIAETRWGANNWRCFSEFTTRYMVKYVCHNGNFWSEKDNEIILSSGFKNVEFSIQSYTWDFHNEIESIDFCKNLFGLDKASEIQIHDGIHTILKAYTSNDNKFHIPWQLGYFICKK